MKKTNLLFLPVYFDRYINLVDDISITDALEKYGIQYVRDESTSFKALGQKVYAPNKWTINEILQHIIDTERIFTYRALRFARNDQTVLSGYDENEYTIASNANNRKLDDLIIEFEAVRESTLILFKSFDNDMLQKEGICFDKKISVLAIGFTVCGHLIHHLNVLKERYYPILE